MTKNLIVTLALSWLVILPTHAQKKQSDSAHDRLLGRVESVRWESATVTDRSGQLVSEPPQWLWTDTYDLDGNVIQRVFNDGDKSVFNYDSAGNKTSKEYVGNGGEEANVKGSKGKAQEVTPGDGAVAHSRVYKYKYDSRGLRTEESVYAENGSLIERTKYSYDAKGNRKQSINVQKGSSQIAKAMFTYADAGDPTQRDLHIETNGGRGALDIREFYQYKYDDAGNWIRRVTARGFIKPVFVEVSYRIITYHKERP